ncbi:MAG: hypothetical protein LBO78_00355, partial [Rickettsiales bacterium]|nr:hypothetical protein [Rickettsiales bacterium]
MKKFVSILFVLAFAAASAAGFDAFAQKKVSARAGGSKRSSARGLPKEAPAPRASAENAPGSFPAPRAAVPPAPRASAENAPAAAKTAPAAKDSGATPAPPEGKPWKLDCQERFNMCMDDTCVNEQGIRYNCSSSLD